MKLKKTLFLTLVLAGASVGGILPTPAAEKPRPAQTAAAESERTQIDAIKEKYWARGDDSELGVVQNRLYTKSRKLEVEVLTGIPFTDPFLDVKSYGGAVGWHLNEYFSLRALGWKASVSPSSALLTFQKTLNASANTNEPRSFLGGELAGSLLYGKLSLLGKKIIYYDLHLLAGAGATSTESGDYFTPFAGIGQQVYLSRRLTLKVDYRLMRYHEQILEKVIPTHLGEVVDERTNWSNTITFGISVLFGGGEEQ